MEREVVKNSALELLAKQFEVEIKSLIEEKMRSLLDERCNHLTPPKEPGNHIRWPKLKLMEIEIKWVCKLSKETVEGPQVQGSGSSKKRALDLLEFKDAEKFLDSIENQLKLLAEVIGGLEVTELSEGY
ncbi:hypothetical protein PPACK8108_LOCUS18749 [Phakopsora pachyrhizi]|uniref:Uncharacterized protein n=1 Tax=Phakopsora pachyrhizi TaxID=170000 RepID=A0AAV0BCP9_PHAPC|nr:hypothetical protein PPACK8108_LOCUS18749 [Phakopsora pachyrhizi]